MTRPDDSTLDPVDLRAVEEQAHRLLDRADAWDRYPVPVNDILFAAKVRVAPTSAFDSAAIISYIKGKAADTSARIKSAISKVFGLYDADDAVIHIDNTIVKAKQTFLKLHETGHHDMPWHRKMFRFFQDCKKTLAPDVADQFEREANNFARYLLFKGPTFAERAADCPFEIKTPIALARKFGASVYAAAREYARTNPRACVVFVLEPLENGAGSAFPAPVRRIESSPAFQAKFGHPTINAITPDHLLWPVIPIQHKMAGPITLAILDLNGQQHECLAEAFNTTYNILILLYPLSALTATTVLMPDSVNVGGPVAPCPPAIGSTATSQAPAPCPRSPRTTLPVSGSRAWESTRRSSGYAGYSSLAGYEVVGRKVLDRIGVRVGGVLSEVFRANGRRTLNGPDRGLDPGAIFASLDHHVVDGLKRLQTLSAGAIAPPQCR